MSRPAVRSPGEFAVLVLLALFCLIFVLVGVLVPDKDTGALAVQNGFLLAAMAEVYGGQNGVAGVDSTPILKSTANAVSSS